MDKKTILNVANVIWKQILATASNHFVVLSWGILSKAATKINYVIDGHNMTMPALVLTVNGMLYQGRIFIALDEMMDEYRIFTLDKKELVEQRYGVGVEELAEVLDSIIEKDPAIDDNTYLTNCQLL